VSTQKTRGIDPQGDPGLDARGKGRVRAIGSGIACVIFLILALVDLSRPREQVFDFYQRLMPRQIDAMPAIVVEIDDETLA
jgi:CHASE2 domain-containing sensor protein